MAVNFLKFPVFILTFYSLLSCALHTSADISDGDPIVDYMIEEVRDKIRYLDETIEHCSDIAQTRNIHSLESLQSLALAHGREALLTGVGNLSFRNQLACEMRARESLSYAFETLHLVAEGNNKLPEDIAAYPQRLLYPDGREIEYELKYRELPDGLRSQLETMLGKEPFDLLNILDHAK